MVDGWWKLNKKESGKKRPLPRGYIFCLLLCRTWGKSRKAQAREWHGTEHLSNTSQEHYCCIDVLRSSIVRLQKRSKWKYRLHCSVARTYGSRMAWMTCACYLHVQLRDVFINKSRTLVKNFLVFIALLPSYLLITTFWVSSCVWAVDQEMVQSCVFLILCSPWGEKRSDH